MGEIFLSSFVLVLLATISPLPALPVILDAYYRHSFLAMPFVFCATAISSLIYYYIGRFSIRFGVQPFLGQFLRLSPFTLPESIRSLSVIEHTSIRLCGFIPFRLYSISCGAFKISKVVYLVSSFIPFLFYHSLYVFGVRALQDIVPSFCSFNFFVLCRFLPVLFVWLISMLIFGMFSKMPFIRSFRSRYLLRLGLLRPPNDV